MTLEGPNLTGGDTARAAMAILEALVAFGKSRLPDLARLDENSVRKFILLRARSGFLTWTRTTGAVDGLLIGAQCSEAELSQLWFPTHNSAGDAFVFTHFAATTPEAGVAMLVKFRLRVRDWPSLRLFGRAPDGRFVEYSSADVLRLFGDAQARCRKLTEEELASN